MAMIKRNPKLSEVPDWATEGKKVAVVQRNSYGNQMVSFFPVTRTTATQVVIGDTRYNIKTGLEQIGWTNVWASAPFLADPEDPQVKLSGLESAERLARHRVRLTAETFDKKGTEEAVARIENAIEEWRTADIALGEFRDNLKDEAKK